MANGKFTLAGLRRMVAFIDEDEDLEYLDKLDAMSDEDVRRNIAEMGVDVPAFEKRMRARIEQAIAEGKSLPDGALKEG
jgi:hypothetical protein